MKTNRIISAIMLLFMIFISVSCGKRKDGDSTTTDNSKVAYTSAEELLSVMWAGYNDNEKFPVIGGDESNINDNGPGKYSIEDPEVLDNILGFPISEINKIDGAASLMHAMNQNTFTCAAFHFKSANDVEHGITALKTNILARRWVCGFPDSLIIAKVPGNYVIAVWGIDESGGIISLFKQKLLASVDGAQIIVDEPIV